MSIIEVNHVTKEYRLGQISNLKRSIQGVFAPLRGKKLPERPLFKALDNIEFKVKKGEEMFNLPFNG